MERSLKMSDEDDYRKRIWGLICMFTDAQHQVVRLSHDLERLQLTLEVEAKKVGDIRNQLKRELGITTNHNDPFDSQLDNLFKENSSEA